MKKIKLIVFVLLLLTSLKLDAQNNVGIGTYTPHSSSILELKATDKGILIPRLSTGQRMSIVNPENALLVFDTDFNCFYYFTAVNGWLSLCSGNSGTSSSNLLVNSTIEAPGSNCSSGGILLTFGNDLNNNGVLDATEVNPTLTQYVCNGATGPQGPAGATGAQGPQGIQGVAGAQGPIGLTGPQGAQGIQGLAGTNGTNGLNTLVLTTSEPSGANCSTGGVKIEYGLDANNNGVLDALEINSSLTQYVCNGATGPQGPAGATGVQGPVGLTGPQGPQGIQGVAGANGTNGLNTLVLTTSEPSGVNCSTGGVKIEYGLDANNNSVLDAIEINSSLTQYVCNGATGLQGPAGAQGPIGLTGSQGPQGIQGVAGAQGPIGLTGPQGAQGIQGLAGTNGTNGLNTLVLTTSEPSGANCSNGGVKIEYGLDANYNGILDAIEINSSLTQYVCNGATGPQGPAGATGAQGPVGLTGPQGPQGIQGVAGAQGPIGLTGAQGAQGIQGVAGTNGTNGLNTLVLTTSEPSGANCSNGGVKIEYGLDANYNGVLDAIEINSSLTQYVCNGATGLQGPAGAQGPIGLTGPQGPQGIQGVAGANGTNGLNTLVLTTSEPSGVNCSTGGVKIEYGLDANNNGVLDAIEINSSLTQYVCNGATGLQGPAGATGAQGPVGLTGPQGPQGIQGVAGAQGPIGLTGAQGAQGMAGTNGTNGLNTLVLTTSEPSGANCSNGGVKIEYGLDTNNNGILDALEINSSLTQYVCNGATGLQGPAGAQGPVGLTGSQGPQGIQGVAGAQGPIGLTGAQGAQGIQGLAGTNGTNGLNTLVLTTSEPSGANCSNGGVKIEYGLDANYNGILDALEINSSLTQYVCNGATGPQGPAGATGAQGPVGLTGSQGPQGIQGVAGTTGLQGPAGAAGTNGLNTLVLTTSEPSGANCSNGGVKIEYGLDANNNGVLDAIEINSSLTQYVCNGATGLQGPAGATGAQGPIGLTGPQGPQGIQGIAGAQGPIGLTGPQGAQGIQGPTGATGPSMFSNMLVYATPGTFSWTVPAGVTKIMVEVWGGGGGGGNSSATVTGVLSSGAGGGYGRSIFSVTSSTNYSIIVGAGGTAGGGDGATSSFGTLINATGGIGGNSVGIYKIPDGGTSNGIFNVTGGQGNFDSSNTGRGPYGGGSYGSHGGRGGMNSIMASPGNTPGGGGGGGAGYTSATYAPGAAGAAGRVVIWY